MNTYNTDNLNERIENLTIGILGMPEKATIEVSKGFMELVRGYLVELSTLRADIVDRTTVKVVYCKDCRYWRESEIVNRAFCEYDTDEINVERYANDSCSYGERREAAPTVQEANG